MTDIPPILELGDLVPEFRPIRINRTVDSIIDESGQLQTKTQLVTLQGYVYGPRCPVLVKAALAQVSRRFRDKLQELGQFSDDLFQEYARDSFMQLIKGIQLDEADMIAADDGPDGKCIKTLKYLNYWIEQRQSVDDQDAKGDEDDPNLVREDESQITQKSSPISS